jgi:hypothetical protein
MRPIPLAQKQDLRLRADQTNQPSAKFVEQIKHLGGHFFLDRPLISGPQCSPGISSVLLSGLLPGGCGLGQAMINWLQNRYPCRRLDSGPNKKSANLYGVYN